jgi:hypothetical protein
MGLVEMALNQYFWRNDNMIYTDKEIEFLFKCLKYFKKYGTQIVCDPEGIIWFPEKELKINKTKFFEMADSIFKKAQKDNLIIEKEYDYGTWELFDIIIIDTKIVIGTLYDGHYALAASYI